MSRQERVDMQVGSIVGNQGSLIGIATRMAWTYVLAKSSSDTVLWMDGAPSTIRLGA